MAQVFFKCGSKAIPSGVIELDVTGLNIPFSPSVLQLSVSAPTTDSDLISAYPVGSATEDGFFVQFSSLIPSSGYVLNWTACADFIIPDSSDTLTLQYSDFFAGIKRFLGYGGSAATLTDDQTESIDEYVQAGLRQFYYPPMVPGADVQHEWSFLRPIIQVVLSPGSSSALLPDGFGRLIGNLEFAPEKYIAAAVPVSEGLVRERLASRPERGAPKFVCARRVSSFGASGQRSELLMWPTPDEDYVLTFMQESDSGKISDSTRPFPLGGSRFSELILESCLSIAEQRANDEEGLHTKRFQSLLASAVIQDRKFSADFYGQLSAPSLGNASSSDFLGRMPCQRGAFKISYKGATW